MKARPLVVLLFIQVIQAQLQFWHQTGSCMRTLAVST